MSAIIEFVKFALIPGSLSFLVLTATMGLGLMMAASSRLRRLGYLLLASVIAGYWACSLPAVADALQGAPGRPSAEAERCIANQHCTLVVLGSGMQAFRSGGSTISTPMPQTVLNALRARELGTRTDGFIIVSGGGPPTGHASSEAALVAGMLQQAGLEASRLLLEPRSHTTHEQAIEVARLMTQHGIGEIVLITSPAHLRRALAAFRAQGVTAVGYPARVRSEPSGPRWLPSLGSWVITRDAVYEYAAYLYYWSRGWI